MPQVAPLQILPIWNECSQCLRIDTCQDSFPASGICPHPHDHLLGQKHPTRRWPEYWAYYQECLQDDAELKSIFLRWQMGKRIENKDFLTLRRRVLDAGLLEATSVPGSSMLLPGPRWLLWDLVDQTFAQLHQDFVAYYGLDAKKLSYLLQNAFDGSPGQRIGNTCGA